MYFKSNLGFTTPRRALTLQSDKDAKQSPVGTLKFEGQTKESENRFPSKNHSYGSMLALPHWEDRAVRIRGEDCAVGPTCEMDVQRELDAAHALVELANDVSGSPKNDLGLNGRNHSVFRMQGVELLTKVLADDNRERSYRFGEDVQMKKKTSGRLHLPKAAFPAERKQKKRKVKKGLSLPQSDNMNDYVNEEEDNLHETYGLSGGHELIIRLRNRGRQNIGACVSDGRDRLLGCKSVTKKRKGKADMSVVYMDGSDEYDHLHSMSQKLIGKPTSLKKKPGLREVDAETSSLSVGVTCDPLVLEIGVMDDAVPETKPLKKQRFALIVPTVQTGFSFSIIHLLSAIRMVMVALHAEDGVLVLGKCIVKTNGKGIHSHESDINNSEQRERNNFPSLTIHEIVQRVRSNPGDPSILETQEPLQDLVRGVLKIFSSKTAPLGAKHWKALTFYEKSSKSWSWIGPVSFNSSNHNTIQEEISPEAWGLPRRFVVKLVDSFANWLKSGQVTLQKIGSLPAPPVTLMQPTLDVKERFKGHRAQKSLATISPSCEEVRVHFHREEVLRYLVPDRAFSYTTIDGRKSTVAPLRRCSGKPSAKARDHFMLKPDRPAHVTVLCLVRDAAARLPESIGTRADVCTLIRDSQYIVEEVSDSQINQVVSGALDRLHYELDPCVQFNKDRQLWVYLHREREEEDFDDDGTSSTKNWKGQRRNAMEHSFQTMFNVT